MCTNNFFLITSSENIIPMITRSKTFKNLAYLSISAPLKKTIISTLVKEGKKSSRSAVVLHLYLSVLIYKCRSPSTFLGLHLDVVLSILISRSPSRRLGLHLYLSVLIYKCRSPSTFLGLHLDVVLSILISRSPSRRLGLHLHVSASMYMSPPPSICLRFQLHLYVSVFNYIFQAQQMRGKA